MVVRLNEKLLIKQSVTEIERQQLLKLHEELNNLIDNGESMSDEERLSLPKQIEDIEFKMQELWHFDKNPNHHTHWLKLRYNNGISCTCPVLDNRDYLGYAKIINCECPFHGVKS